MYGTRTRSMVANEKVLEARICIEVGWLKVFHVDIVEFDEGFDLLGRITSGFFLTCAQQLVNRLLKANNCRGVDRTNFERPPMSPQSHGMCSVNPIHDRIEEKQQFDLLEDRLLLTHQLPALLAISIVIDGLILAMYLAVKAQPSELTVLNLRARVNMVPGVLLASTYQSRERQKIVQDSMNDIPQTHIRGGLMKCFLLDFHLIPNAKEALNNPDSICLVTELRHHCQN